MRSKEENIELIKKLSDANGVSGFEDEVATLCQKEINSYCNCEEDSLRNVYFSLKSNTGKKPKVWLDAHSDEVGFIVQCLKNNGTMNFLPLGGWSGTTIPSSKVRVKTNSGKYIPGIVAAKPVHFMNEAERNQELRIDNMVVDVGARSLDELKNAFDISLAAPIVPDVKCSFDSENELFLGKAFDCRIGCAAMIETLNQCQNEDLEVDIVGTFSAQEEVGERGMEAAVKRMDADIAIVFEGCPADDTFYEEEAIQSGLKRGPMIRHFDCSMITNHRFIRHALDIAKKHSMPVQEAVRSGGGTNAKFLHTTRNGMPTIVVGVPVRYVHSHHGFVAYQDYLDTIALVKEILMSLNNELIQSF